ncbi:MAG: hypothetical protein NC337_08815 [Roseburia sp.]|nr:hypothetical protein [Roseburia sp.]
MQNDFSTMPMIVIDSKNSRIRIHRNTLHLLGDPEYIQLLVNPERLTLAILPSQRLKTANAVRWDRIAESKSCELYSKILIRQLGSICPNWKTDGKYRLYGTYTPDRRLIQFDMASAETV